MQHRVKEKIHRRNNGRRKLPRTIPKAQSGGKRNHKVEEGGVHQIASRRGGERVQGGILMVRGKRAS